MSARPCGMRSIHVLTLMSSSSTLMQVERRFATLFFPVVPIPRISLKSMLERILKPSTALMVTSYGGAANFSE